MVDALCDQYVQTLVLLREVRAERKKIEADQAARIKPHKAQIDAIKAHFSGDLSLLTGEEERLTAEFRELWTELTAARAKCLLGRKTAEDLPSIEGVTVRLDTVPDIVDDARVPDDFKIVDLKKLRACKGAQIDGVQWCTRPTPVVKT